MANESIIKQNKEILNSFLKEKEIPKNYKVPKNDIPFGYIYCIENTINHKKYIGSVYSIWTGARPDTMSQLRKRASDYIYEYNFGIRNVDIRFKRYQRPLIQALITEGIQNFIMYPIAETTRNTHNIAETFFINKFNTIENGYNKRKVDSNKAFRSKGNKHDARAKKLRSEPVICINTVTKEILFSDSMKLFGDYMNSSKDMMKNTARSGRSYKNWFIFYINNDKRYQILNSIMKGTNNTKHSEKSKSLYKNLCVTVNLYLNNIHGSEYFPDFKLLDPLIYKD